MKKLFKIGIICFVMIVFISGCSKSSEKELDVNNYKSLIEFNISSNPHFAVVIDNNNNISHLFFLNNDSKSIYNASVEGKNITDGLSTLMQKLWNDDYFKDSVDINLVNYGDDSTFNDLYEEVNKNLVVLSIKGTVNKENKSLSDLCSDLGIGYSDDVSALMEFDNYSKNIVK